MRQAFRSFFEELDTAVKSRGNSIKFVLHGSRREAYSHFCHALIQEPEAYHVLLVDSEEPVKRWGECWRHLRERKDDGWARPEGTDEAQCQLMVEALEAWFFADPDALQAYYGADLQTSSLPSRQHVEEIPKSQHLLSLEAATRQTKKGIYHKTQHLPGILQRLNAAKVRESAWHCDRIFVNLSARMGARMTPLCKFTQEP